MEIICIDQFAVPAVYPLFLKNCLAVRTVAVAAGVGVEINIVAFGTPAYVIAEAAVFAVHDAVCRLFLDFGRIELQAVIIPAVSEYLFDTCAVQIIRLPSCPVG